MEDQGESTKRSPNSGLSFMVDAESWQYFQALHLVGIEPSEHNITIGLAELVKSLDQPNFIVSFFQFKNLMVEVESKDLPLVDFVPKHQKLIWLAPSREIARAIAKKHPEKVIVANKKTFGSPYFSWEDRICPLIKFSL